MFELNPFDCQSKLVRETGFLIRNPPKRVNSAVFQFKTREKLCAKLKIAQGKMGRLLRNRAELCANPKIAPRVLAKLFGKMKFPIRNGRRLVAIS